jgi:integrase
MAAPAVVSSLQTSKRLTPFGAFFAQHYAGTLDVTKGRTKDDLAAINNWVLPFFADIPCGELEQSTTLVKAWKTQMRSTPAELRRQRKAEGLPPGPLKPRTVNDYVDLLSKMIEAAINDYFMDRNPIMNRSGRGRAIEPDDFDQREVWLTVGEVDELAQAFVELGRTAPRYEALPQFKAHTGVRWGELVVVRNRDIIEHPYSDGIYEGVARLRIERAWSRKQGQIVGPKTKAGKRDIALDEATFEMLQRHRATFTDRRDPDALIFTSAGGSRGSGGMLQEANFRRIWERAIELLGWTERWPEWDGLKRHDLRHTHATWLMVMDDPRRSDLHIAARMGHQDASTTKKIYAHIARGRDGNVLTAVEMGLRAPATVLQLPTAARR